MIITILSEPRSGSTNLTNWFYFNDEFTVMFLPSNPKSKWFNEEKNLEKYKYKTEHLLVKEDYYHYKDYSEFLNTSDKKIYLYRENEKEQIESWVNAVMTGNFDNPWIKKIEKNEEQELFFKQLKLSFKEKYLNNDDNFIISYEDLYYGNGINRIIDYLGIENLKNKKFPYGSRYRIIKNNSKNLI
jgi:hypothetical protein